MKLRALSHYRGDTDTRFGDCILIYDSSTLVVYDCGHTEHSQAVQAFLRGSSSITTVRIVISHNDSDHTCGIEELLDWLSAYPKYSVEVYAHQYLKHVDTILEKIDDARRNRESLKESLLAEFDDICTIIETAQKYEFGIFEAKKNTMVGYCTIVGPTVDEFTDAAAQAIDSRVKNNIGVGHAEETVMNAASVQLKCRLDDGSTAILCGDACSDFLHDIDVYDLIQLPHHGQLDDAKAVFAKLKDPYNKIFLVSDNTGSGCTSGGSDDLVQYMKDEYYSPAKNTKDGIVNIPAQGFGVAVVPPSNSKGVILGDMDFKH